MRRNSLPVLVAEEKLMLENLSDNKPKEPNYLTNSGIYFGNFEILQSLKFGACPSTRTLQVTLQLESFQSLEFLATLGQVTATSAG